MSKLKNKEGYLAIYSRHKSHDRFRNLIKVDTPMSIRFGSSTHGKQKIRFNSVEAVEKSSDKLLMKHTFGNEDYVPEYIYYNGKNFIFKEASYTIDTIKSVIKFPILSKLQRRSRAQGMVLVEDEATLNDHLNQMITRYDNGQNNRYLEFYYNYGKEYRFHTNLFTQECFYSCRKALKKDAEIRWYKNDSNSVWFYWKDEKGKFREQYKAPDNLEDIVTACLELQERIGLDITAFDVIVAKDGRFKILECNSAPSMEDIVFNHYVEQLTDLVAEHEK